MHEGSAITQMLKRWTTEVDKDSEPEHFDELMMGMTELLSREEDFMASDVFVCTALFAPCISLFIAMLHSGARETSNPDAFLLFYQSTELLLSVPEERKENVVEDMQHFLDHLLFALYHPVHFDFQSFAIHSSP